MEPKMYSPAMAGMVTKAMPGSPAMCTPPPTVIASVQSAMSRLTRCHELMDNIEGLVVGPPPPCAGSSPKEGCSSLAGTAANNDACAEALASRLSMLLQRLGG